MKRIVISSGVGPQEVRRFVAELAGFITREIESDDGRVFARSHVGVEEAPRSVSLQVVTDKPIVEGVYLLVASSETRGKRSRKRWYVSVRSEDADETNETLALSMSDVVFSTCKAGGAGGQHVNKTESAVRLLHRPSGISIKVMTERSQHTNRKIAIRLLSLELDLVARRNVQNQKKAQRNDHYRLERGNPVRTFVRGRKGELIET